MRIDRTKNKIIFHTGYDEFKLARLLESAKGICPDVSPVFNIQMDARRGLLGVIWKDGGITEDGIDALIAVIKEFDESAEALEPIASASEIRTPASRKAKRHVHSRNYRKGGGGWATTTPGGSYKTPVLP